MIAFSTILGCLVHPFTVFTWSLWPNADSSLAVNTLNNTPDKGLNVPLTNLPWIITLNCIQHVGLLEPDPFPGITGKGTHILQISLSSYHLGSFLLSQESNRDAKATVIRTAPITANMHSWMKIKCPDCNRHVQSIIYFKYSFYMNTVMQSSGKLLHRKTSSEFTFMWVLIWVIWTHYTTTLS